MFLCVYLAISTLFGVLPFFLMCSVIAEEVNLTIVKTNHIFKLSAKVPFGPNEFKKIT